MRKLLVILPLIIFAKCKKEDSVKIALHQRSFAWLMEAPVGYVNNSGDTLFITNLSESNEYISENLVPSQLPPYTQSERYIQTFAIDTFLTYQTVLIAEITQELTRNDFVSIQFAKTNQSYLKMLGNAEPFYSLIAPYRDSVVLNGIIYENIYSQSNSSQLEMFVNLKDGLVGFTLDADTFNIVN